MILKFWFLILPRRKTSWISYDWWWRSFLWNGSTRTNYNTVALWPIPAQPSERKKTKFVRLLDPLTLDQGQRGDFSGLVVLQRPCVRCWRLTTVLDPCVLSYSCAMDHTVCRAAGALPQRAEDTIGRNPCVRGRQQSLCCPVQDSELFHTHNIF